MTIELSFTVSVITVTNGDGKFYTLNAKRVAIKYSSMLT